MNQDQTHYVRVRVKDDCSAYVASIVGISRLRASSTNSIQVAILAALGRWRAETGQTYTGEPKCESKNGNVSVWRVEMGGAHA